MLIKICGLKRQGDAEAAIAAGADLLGFILVPGTSRYVEPHRAMWIRDLSGAATVGVFRDAPVESVLRAREALGLDWVQLHGDEPDSFLEQLGDRVLRRITIPASLGSEKAADLPADLIWSRVLELQPACLPLLDPGAGDGAAWDWSALGPGPEGARFGLAGGLDPGNVTEAIRRVRPSLVDVSSGVEPRAGEPGTKDPALIRSFVEAAHRAAPKSG